MIYLDYNATTPLDVGVREVMLPFLDVHFGNPSSIHKIGRNARAALDEAREKLAQTMVIKPSEVIFTSGGSESNNLAILGAARQYRQKGKHLITSKVEHPSVLRCFEYLQKHEGFDVDFLPVDSAGIVSPDELAKALRADTVLVSIMAANNETGTLQPVAQLGALCRERGVLFHTDAAQWFGKEPFSSAAQFNADLITLCAHKFHGPKGAAALLVRSPLPIQSLILGGGQENEHRAGTENLAAIVGMAESAHRFIRTPVFDPARVRPLIDHLRDTIQQWPDVSLHGCQTRRLANTLAFTLGRVDSLTLLAALDMAHICASGGSACSSGALQPSHVLLAMGVPPELGQSLIRISIGRENTLPEIEHFTETLLRIYNQVRQLATFSSKRKLPLLSSPVSR